MKIGTANPPSSAWREKNLRQFSTPVAGVLALGDVPAVHDQPDRPDLGRPSACWMTSLRDGMRMRLFSDARLTT